MSNTSFLLSYNNESGYGWYECNCCPYGYHIDLDFVRYCETIGRQAERTGSIQRRRDRRRQRQSMDMLLGLAPPSIASVEQNNFKTIKENDRNVSSTEASLNSKIPPFIHDELDDVVNDFERTLQRSKTKLSNNLPDVTAVSDNIHRVPSMSSITSASSIPVLPATNDLSTGKEFDVVSIESCGLSPAALQNIREQMALSLERTRKLEDRILVIPKLEAQLLDLKSENRRLLLQLQCADATTSNSTNANYATNNYSKVRSQSLTEVDSCDNGNRSPLKPPSRDFGVMCGVLTRNVGVGHQYPNTRTVATITPYSEETKADRWLDEKYKFLNGDKPLHPEGNTKMISTKHTQTLQARGNNKHNYAQTVAPKKKEFAHKGVQSFSIKHYQTIGMSARPETANKAIQNVVEMVSVASSNDRITDEYCLKCSVEKKSIGIGPESNNVTNVAPISLASLSSKSKSFNLGEERLNLTTRNRTVACQCETFTTNKASQYNYVGLAKACQHELKYHTKASQYDIDGVSKMTDTKDLQPIFRSVGCEAKEVSVEVDKKDVGCNANAPTDTIVACGKCTARERADVAKKDKEDTPSRIPRLQMPTTPTENRKFKRQDTYTKIPALIPASPTTSLSGLDLTTKSTESPSALDKVKQSFKFYTSAGSSSDTQISATQNGINLPSSSKDATESLPDTAIYNPTTSSQRPKAMPSKEMQAAMKVLNDALRKDNSKNMKHQLKNATNIIQQEWFNVSSSINANPLDVDDYLDCFEDVSYPLLEYIVNMSDASGNTAMHYAVSHGNFDVVSILLDSKVCDINKQNKAGYTSVMLVSLAQVRSKTHAHVVKRLFQLADVNIRAKQHGQTALMLAVSHGRLDMVQMLLDAGADINIQDEDGSTALMCAAEHGHAEIVKHFLAHPDCDSSLCDVDGSTALNIAMEAGHRHIGLLLYAHDRNLHDPKLKRHKSHSSSSPKVPSSPSLPIRSFNRALPDTKK